MKAAEVELDLRFHSGGHRYTEARNVSRQVAQQGALAGPCLAMQDEDPALSSERLPQQAVERRAFLASTEEFRRLGGGETGHLGLLGSIVLTMAGRNASTSLRHASGPSHSATIARSRSCETVRRC